VALLQRSSAILTALVEASFAKFLLIVCARQYEIDRE
jgi:hypothetical protein